MFYTVGGRPNYLLTEIIHVIPIKGAVWTVSKKGLIMYKKLLILLNFMIFYATGWEFVGVPHNYSNSGPAIPKEYTPGYQRFSGTDQAISPKKRVFDAVFINRSSGLQDIKINEEVEKIGPQTKFMGEPDALREEPELLIPDSGKAQMPIEIRPLEKRYNI